LTTPVAAFITFKEEKTARDLYKHSSIDILGCPCEINKAKDPSVIIFENLQFDIGGRKWVKFVTLIETLVIFLLIVVFLAKS